ncbi:hypothetical protein BS47DRAFT_1438565, partial [Hydnum rufescens UP504]
MLEYLDHSRPYSQTQWTSTFNYVGRVCQKHHLFRFIWMLRDMAFSNSTICAAFHKCGINPFNPEVFSKVDFGPSQATSTIASSHLPP